MELAAPPLVASTPSAPAVLRNRSVLRSQDGRVATVLEAVAEEVPVALTYNGSPHAVMMATPADLEDFAVGFTLAEGIVADAAEIRSVAVRKHEAGCEAAIEIPSERQFLLAARQRNLAGRTGCGLCGTRALAEVVRPARPVPRTLSVTPDALLAAAGELAALQPLNARTGATHAAGWASREGSIRIVREDIGRHIALDKLIGALARSRVVASEGFVVLTSRASFEMVQKAATAGVELVAAYSAPTTLAVDQADKAGVTLIAFVRARRFTVYSHPARIHPDAEA